MPPGEKVPPPATPAEYYARELIQQVSQLTGAVHGLTKAVLLNAQATVASGRMTDPRSAGQEIGGLARDIASLLRGLR